VLHARLNVGAVLRAAAEQLGSVLGADGAVVRRWEGRHPGAIAGSWGAVAPLADSALGGLAGVVAPDGVLAVPDVDADVRLAPRSAPR